MRRRGPVRYAIPLLGAPIAGVAVGAGMSMLATSMVVRVLAIVLGTILITGFVVSTAPVVLAKSRTLAASLRWWHWLWLLVFLSGLVFRIRDIETIHDAPVDAWAAWRIGLMALVAVVLLSRLPGGRPDWVAAIVRGLPAGVFLYGVMALISTLWSVYPLWTLYRSVEYLIDVA